MVTQDQNDQITTTEECISKSEIVVLEVFLVIMQKWVYLPM